MNQKSAGLQKERAHRVPAMGSLQQRVVLAHGTLSLMCLSANCAGAVAPSVGAALVEDLTAFSGLWRSLVRNSMLVPCCCAVEAHINASALWELPERECGPRADSLWMFFAWSLLRPTCGVFVSGFESAHSIYPFLGIPVVLVCLRWRWCRHSTLHKLLRVHATDSWMLQRRRGTTCCIFAKRPLRVHLPNVLFSDENLFRIKHEILHTLPTPSSMLICPGRRLPSRRK